MAIESSSLHLVEASETAREAPRHLKRKPRGFVEHRDVESGIQGALESQDLDMSAIGLLLRDARAYEIPSHERQKLLGSRVLSAKYAIYSAGVMLESESLTEDQRKKLLGLRADKNAMFLAAILDKEIDAEKKQANGSRRILLGELESLKKNAEEKLLTAEGDEIDQTITEYSSQIENGKDSFFELTLGNTRLALFFAFRYQITGLQASQLTGAAYDGLMRAAAKYDPRRGTKFSTYASRVIISSIRDEIREKGKTIKIPNHVQDKLRRLAREEERLIQETGEWSDLPLEPGMAEAIRAAKTISIDQPLGAAHADDGTIGDFIPDEADVENEALPSFLTSELEPLLSILSVKQRRAIERRFGFDGRGGLTLGEIAREDKTTRSAVKQTVDRALNKLRRQDSIWHLKAYLTE